MATRTLANLTFPLSNSNKLFLRKEFKQHLGLPKNASEKKLADSLGVSLKELYPVLLDTYNEYVETYNADLEAKRKAQRKAKRKEINMKKKEEKTVRTYSQLNQDFITKEMRKKYSTKAFNFTMSSLVVDGVTRSLSFKIFTTFISGLTISTMKWKHIQQVLTRSI